MLSTGLHNSAMIMILGQKSSLCPNIVAKRSLNLHYSFGVRYSVAKRNKHILGNSNQLAKNVHTTLTKAIRNNRCLVQLSC